MVLSNKKLKQKLREAKAESILGSESNGKELTLNLENSRLQELLEAAKQSSRLSKREKRRKNQSLLELNGTQKSKKDKDQENKVIEEKNEKYLVAIDDNEENKRKQKKKRKREETESKEKGSLEDGVVKEAKKAKNKKKKKKKKSKKANNVEEKVGDEAKEVTEATDMIIESQISEDSATRVYVGGIPYYSTEDDIRSYFESCGTITDVDCMTFPDSGKFRGIAIIGFKTEAAAKRALALDGSDMGGFFLKIQPYKTTRTSQAKKVSNFAPKIVEGYNRIYVGNLSWDITEEDLRKFFSGCNISSIRWGMDKETGEFRGYGHVDFADNFSLLMALKLDQQIVCERPIKISCAVPLKGAKVHTTSAPAVTANEADDCRLSAVSGKMRRRTCYDCNQKGHVSTDCPNKLATASPTVPVTANEADKNASASTAVPKDTGNEADENASASIALPKDTSNKADNGGLIVSSGKMRRRTCYECNQKGHVSTDCPNKLATAAPTAPVTANEADKNASASTAVPKDTGNQADKKGTSNEVDNGELTVSSGKMRRRTCYECNQKGHISTACPNKKTIETNPNAS